MKGDVVVGVLVSLLMVTLLVIIEHYMRVGNEYVHMAHYFYVGASGLICGVVFPYTYFSISLLVLSTVVIVSSVLLALTRLREQRRDGYN